jgi:hypothetical protein
MFLFRAAFWLVVGFLLVAPHGTDLGSAATSLQAHAVNAGLKASQQIIVSQMATSGDDLLSIPGAMASSPTPIKPRNRPAALG